MLGTPLDAECVSVRIKGSAERRANTKHITVGAPPLPRKMVLLLNISHHDAPTRVPACFLISSTDRHIPRDDRDRGKAHSVGQETATETPNGGDQTRSRGRAMTDSWLDARQAGRHATQEGTLMPAVSLKHEVVCAVPMSATQLTGRARAFFRQHDLEVSFVPSFTSKVCKATMLSWMCMAAAPMQERRLTEGHVCNHLPVSCILTGSLRHTHWAIACVPGGSRSDVGGWLLQGVGSRNISRHAVENIKSAQHGQRTRIRFDSVEFGNYHFSMLYAHIQADYNPNCLHSSAFDRITTVDDNTTTISVFHASVDINNQSC